MMTHYRELGGASDWLCFRQSEALFCAHFSDVSSRGNQWCRLEMWAVFSDYHW